MRITVEPAEEHHARNLSPRLRASDAAEVMASDGFSPDEALVHSLGASDRDLAWAAIEVATGNVVSMFGAAPMYAGNEEIGAAWLLSSPDIDKYHREAWTLSKRHVDLMHDRYPVLTNFIDVRNVTSLRWLGRLGFEPVRFHPFHGVGRLPFLKYESKR